MARKEVPSARPNAPALDFDAGPREESFARRTLRSMAFWLSIIFIVLSIFFSIFSNNHAYFTSDNAFSVALDGAEAVLLAIGMTYLIAAGQLDLSIGSNVILSSVLASKVITSLGGSSDQIAAGTYPHLGIALVAGVAVALLAGILFGAVNGLIVTRLGITSFIVTLGTTGIGLGTTYVITHGTDVAFLPPELQNDFGINYVFGLIPAPVIVSFVIVGVLWFLMATTRFGMRTQAIGSSSEAASRAGIPVQRHVLILFMLMGLLAGVAAIIDISRFGTTNISGHQIDNLSAIAATVLGGTALFGGVASVGGTIVGAFIPVALSTGLILMGVDTFYQLIAVGVILITAVYVQQRRGRQG